MDHRFYFALGDFIANLVVGIVVGLISWAIVAPGWNMLVAMLVMMLLGMIAGLILFFPFALKLGAMEVMVPFMFSGMLSGMVVGMAAAMMPIDAQQALVMGAASGMAGILFIWVANSFLRGVTNESAKGDNG